MSILHKRSLTSGSVPTTSSLEVGQLAINVPDGRLFLRKSGSGVDQVVSAITTNAPNSGSVSLTGSLSISGSGTVFSTVGDSIEMDADTLEMSGSFLVSGSSRFIGNVTATGSLNITGSVAVVGLSAGTGSSHVVMYNTASGQFSFTASSAIGGGGIDTFYQNTQPTGTGTSAIQLESIWIHSDTGIQYSYIYDGDTYQWVQQTLPLGPQGPQGANGTNAVNTLTSTTFNGLLKGNGATISATTVATELGFTPENVANKENTTLDTSSTKYPTNNLVKTNLDNFADDVDYAIMTNQRILFNF